MKFWNRLVNTKSLLYHLYTTLFSIPHFTQPILNFLKSISFLMQDLRKIMFSFKKSVYTPFFNISVYSLFQFMVLDVSYFRSTLRFKFPFLPTFHKTLWYHLVHLSPPVPNLAPWLHMGHGCIDSHILNLSTRWEWPVSIPIILPLGGGKEPPASTAQVSG
jgi:hypothetical protein